MRTLKDYIYTIPLHVAEGRYWSQVDHEELIQWQKEIWELEEIISDLESERNRLVREIYQKDHFCTICKSYPIDIQYHGVCEHCQRKLAEEKEGGIF